MSTSIMKGSRSFYATILRKLSWLVIGRNVHSVAPEFRQRLYFFYFSTMFSGPLNILLLLRDIDTKTTFVIWHAIIASFYSVVINILARRAKKPQYYFHALMFNTLFSYLVSYYGPDWLTTTYFAAVIPVSTFFLFGRRWGTKWSLFIVAAPWLLYGISETYYDNIQVSGEALLMATAGTLTNILLLVVYENINIHFQRLVAERDKQLTHELSEKDELANQLKIVLSSVEHKVEERTQELMQEKARLQASINSLTSGYMMTHGDESVIMYNPSLLGIFELSHKDNAEHAFINSTELLVEIQKQLGTGFDLRQNLNKTMVSLRSFSAKEVKVGGKYIDIIGAPILTGKEDKALGCVVLINDVTEESLLDRSKDEFLSIASHELRTPLTAIKGNTSILQEYRAQIDVTEENKILTDIHDAADRLIAVVNQFLTMSRLEQGRIEIALKSVNITDAIKGVINELSGLAKEKGLTISAQFPDNLGLAKADPSKLEEVLINLIGNAIKYTDQGLVVVTAEEAGAFIRVRVRDSGKGIDAENQKLLFHKFQQATSDILTRDNSRSTGLGLYITKLLVTQMGGTIQLDHSEAGKGSTFSFTLPKATKL